MATTSVRYFVHYLLLRRKLNKCLTATTSKPIKSRVAMLPFTIQLYLVEIFSLSIAVTGI